MPSKLFDNLDVLLSHFVQRTTARKEPDTDHARSIGLSLALNGQFVRVIGHRLTAEEIEILRKDPEQVPKQCREALMNPKEDLLALDDGHHRILGAEMIGWERIAAQVFVVKPTAEQEARAKVILNTSQMKLDPLSTVENVLAYCNEVKCTVKQAALELNIREATFSNSKWLLTASEEIKTLVRNRKLTAEMVGVLRKVAEEERDKKAKDLASGALTLNALKEELDKKTKTNSTSNKVTLKVGKRTITIDESELPQLEAEIRKYKGSK